MIFYRGEKYAKRTNAELSGLTLAGFLKMRESGRKTRIFEKMTRMEDLFSQFFSRHRFC